MKIFKKKTLLNKDILTDKNLCFVPTMGFLHQGHISLIKKAKKKGNKVLVSIYVNPKQFNSKNDFQTYPKNIKKDFKILKSLKVDYLYLPSYKDIFLFKTLNKIYLDKFSSKLCGKYRKGHFEGVLNVVNRFLEIIKPRYIYLGEKDFQQLCLIKKHIEKNKINTTVISCRSIREKNGLVYSSRNTHLSINQKIIASKIYKILRRFKLNLIKNKLLKINYSSLRSRLVYCGIKKVDYIEILDLKTLKKPKTNKNKFNIFIAYYLGNIRLIDNI